MTDEVNAIHCKKLEIELHIFRETKTYHEHYLIYIYTRNGSSGWRQQHAQNLRAKTSATNRNVTVAASLLLTPRKESLHNIPTYPTGSPRSKVYLSPQVHSHEKQNKTKKYRKRNKKK